MKDERQHALVAIDEARTAGARLRPCCEVMGLDVRTVQRWLCASTTEDQRRGPISAPANKLSSKERAAIVRVSVCPSFRGKSPNQIVPLLADEGVYLGSESTFYRVLRAEGLQHHRSPSKAPERVRPKQLTATGPNQVWSWDITYLKSTIKGQFYYLYLFMDVWSRKIVGWRVADRESTTLAGELVTEICASEGIKEGQVALHSDNGSPMKGATMLATLQALGVCASFSRPSVSNDNPYSESLFRTLKYRPSYPSKPFVSVKAAHAWVEEFTHWYNHEHLHSGIRFTTPEARHSGEDVRIIEQRNEVYLRAKHRNPNRWSSPTRNWDRPSAVIMHRVSASSTTRKAA